MPRGKSRNGIRRPVTLLDRGREGPTREGTTMTTGQGHAAIRHVRALFDVGTMGSLADPQLLDRFAGRNGEAAELAFAALVERHGPMVLRVCRRGPRRRDDGARRLPGDLPRAGDAGRHRSAAASRWRAGCTAWRSGSPAAARSSASRRQRSHERRKAERMRRRRPTIRSMTTGLDRPRGVRPAPRSLPRPDRPLRPRRPDPRAGGGAARLAGRDGQEPARPRPGRGSAIG